MFNNMPATIEEIRVKLDLWSLEDEDIIAALKAHEPDSDRHWTTEPYTVSTETKSDVEAKSAELGVPSDIVFGLMVTNAVVRAWKELYE